MIYTIVLIFLGLIFYFFKKSKSNFFYQNQENLNLKRKNLIKLLEAKEYKKEAIKIYLTAFDYFVENPKEYDGATIVKDLCDIPRLSLDAMLHDYQYLVLNAASNFIIKYKVDWLYGKNQERKAKSIYTAYSSFIGLTLLSIGFTPYAYFKRGKIKDWQKIELKRQYNILIK